MATGLPILSFLIRSAADDAIVQVEYSPDLRTWTKVPPENLISREARSDGTTLYLLRMPTSQKEAKKFARLQVELR